MEARFSARDSTISSRSIGVPLVLVQICELGATLYNHGMQSTVCVCGINTSHIIFPKKIVIQLVRKLAADVAHTDSQRH